LSITPIAAKYNDYAERLANRFRFEGYRAIADVSDMTMKKKIRDAQLEHYNYIGIVGAEEERDGTIDIRDRDKSDRIVTITLKLLG
jgi:threonyl-tRNA synthetase